MDFMSKLGHILMSVFMRVESYLGNKLVWTSLTIDRVGDLGCYWKALLLEVGDWQQIQRSKPQAFFPFLTHERSMSTYALLFVECNTHTTPNIEKIKCQGILALGWQRRKWLIDSSFFFWHIEHVFQHNPSSPFNNGMHHITCGEAPS